MKMKILLALTLLLINQAHSEVVTYVCDYRLSSDQDGVKSQDKPFILTFMKDSENGKFYVLGNLGTTEVIAIEKETQITFIEVTSTGNVMTTTIDSKLQTVHSRNSVLFGEIVPSQYYGTCTIK